MQGKIGRKITQHVIRIRLNSWFCYDIGAKQGEFSDEAKKFLQIYVVVGSRGTDTQFPDLWLLTSYLCIRTVQGKFSVPAKNLFCLDMRLSADYNVEKLVEPSA